MRRFLFGLLVLCLAARVVAAPNTQVRLPLSAVQARPGDPVWAGIELKMAAGWHSYWRNGGDSGLPTTVQWTLPQGVEAGPIQWPVPARLVTSAAGMRFISFVYEDTALLLVPLKIGSNAPSGTVRIEAKVAWTECAENQPCVNRKSAVGAELVIGGATALSADAPLIEQWRAKVPPVNPNPSARARWAGPAGTNNARDLLIEWETSTPDANFYPYEAEGLEVSAATSVSNAAPGKVLLRTTVSKLGDSWPGQVRGLLVSAGAQAVEVSLTVAGTEGAAIASGTAGGILWGRLPQMLFFAFLGGLILNLMPCVLPVISLKALAFIGQAGQSPERLRRMGLVYGLGAMVSFAALAAFAILAQRAGGAGDWGAAFRNPQSRLILTLVVTLAALNLFGVFEISAGGRAMDAAAGLAGKDGLAGAFLNGALASVLATPCTAPFLGTALAFAFEQPPAVIVAAFLAAGAGLAAPFVLICLRPSLLGFLPKPGAWMERFKTGVGFAMLATAMWLFWLTGARLGRDGVLWLGLFLVALSFAAWLWGQFVQRPGKSAKLGAAAAAAVLLAAYFGLLEGKLDWRHSGPVAAADRIDWRAWSPEAVVQAQAEGHPVLIDFSADSCLNCQINKLTSLEISSVRARLKALNVVAFLADYTDENPLIAKELARFDRPGVPLVLVYPGKPQAAPVILPVVLTPAIVLEALDRAAK